MPYHKSRPNIVTADTPSSPRVSRYKLRPRKNLSHTGGISTRYNLAINLIQMMEANSVIHTITGVPQEYRHCKVSDHKIWKRSFANELGQLAQGIRNIKGTDTIHFIPKSKVPFGEKTATYGKIVCNIKPDKE